MDNKRVKILIIDDDEDDKRILKSVLEDLNSSVELTAAGNGKEGLALLRRSDSPLPDLILLDINMPVMGGFEFLEVIKADRSHRTIPVVMYSTSSIEPQINKAYEMGANLYLVKPFSMDDYYIFLEKILEMNWQDYVQPQRERFVLEKNQLPIGI